MGPLPEKKVWKFPKLVPVGVFSEVAPRPVNVSINAFPCPPRKVTEFEPLPEQPAQVNTPDVEKVIGDAPRFREQSPSAMTSKVAVRNGVRDEVIVPP